MWIDKKEGEELQWFSVGVEEEVKEEQWIFGTYHTKKEWDEYECQIIKWKSGIVKV